MYKIQDYITYLGYKQNKQKNLCSELLIPYKNMNVSYKLLHFAIAVHWRLPSPFQKWSVHLILRQIVEEVSKKHTNNDMALFS